MSAPSASRTIRDALYEAPGPRTHRRMVVGTIVSALVVLWLVYLVWHQFYVTGQFAPRYWSFFAQWPTWRFLIDGFRGTIAVAVTAGVISLVLGEVFRAGVNAVPKGQVEAAYSLGLTRGKVMRRIVLPQAIHYVIPSLISQLVVVVKDTTVAYVVSYPDLMQNARVLITSYDSLVSVYLVVAIIYILINYAINQASAYVSRRMGVKIIR